MDSLLSVIYIMAAGFCVFGPTWDRFTDWLYTRLGMNGERR